MYMYTDILYVYMYMYRDNYAYIYIYMYTYIHTYIHTYIIIIQGVHICRSNRRRRAREALV